MSILCLLLYAIVCEFILRNLVFRLCVCVVCVYLELCLQCCVVLRLNVPIVRQIVAVVFVSVSVSVGLS